MGLSVLLWFTCSFALFVSLVALGRATRDHYHTKKTIRSLQEQVNEAERLLRQRGDLANEVAHEIKNPITAILCSAETLDLMMGAQLDPENRKSLHYIIEYGDQVLRLLSDFLDISRTESGKITAQPESVDLASTCETVLGLLNSFGQRHHVSLQLVPPAESVVGYVDPRLLKQIIFNLVHNAVKFTPNRGVVTVTVYPTDRAGVAVIEVKDSGVGIPVEALETIFDPYEQLHGPQSAEHHGAGLGLALVKRLVEICGGQIEVESGVGQGTTFRFTVPRDEAPVTVLMPSQKIFFPKLPNKPLLGQTFLVLEEDPATRDSVAQLIAAWGGMVDQVGLATEALKALGNKTYDAVMIDGSSPEIDGRGLAKLVKEEPRQGNTTVILTTSAVNELVSQEGGGRIRCCQSRLMARRCWSRCSGRPRIR